MEGSGPEPRRFMLNTLSRAVVVHRAAYLGDTISLMLVFADGGAVEILMDDPVWPRLVAALDQCGRIPVFAAQWQVEAIAAGPDGSPRELI